jgi:general secretion pathway protein M
MKTWWAHLQQREQRLLGAGAIFFILLFFYFTIIQPISDSLDTQTSNIESQQKLLHWMQTSVPQLQSLRKADTHRQPIPAGNLLSSVEQSLKQSQLSDAVTTLEKNPDDTTHESIQLKFDKVMFDRLMTWLIHFRQTYNVNISQLSIIRTKDPGVVQVNLVLNLPG